MEPTLSLKILNHMNLLLTRRVKTQTKANTQISGNAIRHTCTKAHRQRDRQKDRQIDR